MVFPHLITIESHQFMYSTVLSNSFKHISCLLNRSFNSPFIHSFSTSLLPLLVTHLLTYQPTSYCLPSTTSHSTNSDSTNSHSTNSHSTNSLLPTPFYQLTLTNSLLPTTMQPTPSYQLPSYQLPCNQLPPTNSLLATNS